MEVPKPELKEEIQEEFRPEPRHQQEAEIQQVIGPKVLESQESIRSRLKVEIQEVLPPKPLVELQEVPEAEP